MLVVVSLTISFVVFGVKHDARMSHDLSNIEQLHVFVLYEGLFGCST